MRIQRAHGTAGLAATALVTATVGIGSALAAHERATEEGLASPWCRGEIASAVPAPRLPLASPRTTRCGIKP